MTSKCQFIANRVRGLSSRKQRAAKPAKSSRSNAAHSARAVSPATIAAGVVNRAVRQQLQPPAAIWRRKRATNSSTTSRSGAVNLAASKGAAAPAFCSTSFITSNSILVARRSALGDLLTICVTIASRLVILRPVVDLDDIPAIAGSDLDTLPGVPGFKRMSIEVVGDDLLTTFLARRI
jgi:hypothetical protein